MWGNDSVVWEDIAFALSGLEKASQGNDIQTEMERINEANIAKGYVEDTNGVKQMEQHGQR